MPQITLDTSGMSEYFALMLVAIGVIWGVNKAILFSNKG